MDSIICSNCHQEIPEPDGVYSEIGDKWFCDEDCFRDWRSALEDYMLTLGE